MDNSELKPTEYHMSADHAMQWFKTWQAEDLGRFAIMREAVASTALSGNRLAQVLNGTLDRLANSKPVSDRYLLGLCWYIKMQYDTKENEIQKTDVQTDRKLRKLASK